jgi:hypothetical protein
MLCRFAYISRFRVGALINPGQLIASYILEFEKHGTRYPRKTSRSRRVGETVLNARGQSADPPTHR